jgi:HEAT repeat protein
LDTVLNAVQSADASLRAAAVEALGSFDDKKADAAIIDGFRDSFFRTRLAAVKAAGKKNLDDAIPYLRYRAINDDAASVRDEAINVLGGMNKTEANNILLSILDDTTINDKIRIGCAQSLLKSDSDKYCDHVIELLDEAKQKRYNTL